MHTCEKISRKLRKTVIFYLWKKWIGSIDFLLHSTIFSSYNFWESCITCENNFASIASRYCRLEMSRNAQNKNLELKKTKKEETHGAFPLEKYVERQLFSMLRKKITEAHFYIQYSSYFIRKFTSSSTSFWNMHKLMSWRRTPSSYSQSAIYRVFKSPDSGKEVLIACYY